MVPLEVPNSDGVLRFMWLFHHLHLKLSPVPLPSLPFSLWGTNVEPGSSLYYTELKAGGCCVDNTDPIPTRTLSQGHVSGNIGSQES